MKKRKTTLICLCGKSITLFVSGNNNADAKKQCDKCKRHITIHFRRHKNPLKIRNSQRKNNEN